LRRQLPIEPVSTEEVEAEYNLVTLLACSECDYFRFKEHEGEVVYERRGRCPECGSDLIVEGVFRTEADPGAFPDYEEVKRVLRALEEAGYEVEDHRVLEDGSIELRYERRGDPRELARRLGELGFAAEPGEEAGSLRVFKHVVPKEEPGYLIPLLLSVPIFAWAGGWYAFRSAWYGLEFAVAFSAIFFAKELAKFWAAGREGLDPRLPLALPVPHFPGGYSGVVRSNVRPMLARSLCRVGAAGLSVGFLVSSAVFALGALHRHVPVKFKVLHSTWSLLLASGLGLKANPLTLAGWAGLAVTWLSALPVYPLEGGYIMRYYLGNTGAVRWLSALSLLVQAFLRWYHVAIVALLVLLKITSQIPKDRSFLDDDERKDWGPMLLLTFILACLAAPAPLGLWPWDRIVSLPKEYAWLFLR
jgi:hypothetical protein